MAYVDISYLIISHCHFPKVAGAAVDVIGRQIVRYFLTRTLVGFTYTLWNAESETPDLFLLHCELHHRKPGRATRSTNKKQEKGKNIDLIGQKILESG